MAADASAGQPAKALQKRGIDYRIIEQLTELIVDDGKYILGSAADLEVLEKAGIMKVPHSNHHHS